MERSEPQQHVDAGLARLTDEADAVRRARLRQNLALSPAQRLDKLAALCRQAGVVRDARRLP